MAKTVRVEMHIDSPHHTLHLCDRIIEKNTADGVNSSLSPPIDMTAYAAKVTDAKAKRKDAEKKDETAQKKFQQVKLKCGLAENQNSETKDTIGWFVRQIKNLLLLVHDNNEEALSEYGFNVVITQTGARKNVRIDIPEAPHEMVELGEAIVEEHTALGVNSPLTAALVDMAAFETLVTDTATLRHDSEVLRGESESLFNQALVIIGYAEGQTIDTAGTIYHENGRIRNRLLQKFDGQEKALEEFGFDVVIGETGPSDNNISIAGTVTDTLGNKISGALVLVIQPDIFVSTGADGKYEVPGLPPGTYSLLVHKSGYAEKQVSGIVVTAGSTATANVVLASASTFGTVSGQITQGGSGASGTVTIQMAGSPQVISTDGAGNYIIPNVPPGNYALQGALDSNPANIITHNITAVAGETTIVNFVFP